MQILILLGQFLPDPQMGQGLSSVFNKPSLVNLTQVVGDCFLKHSGLGEG